MRSLVTGVAGFIGSHLAERLISEGYEVIGVDCFTDYYARSIKEQNLKELLKEPGFTFLEENLLETDLRKILIGVDCIFHQAAQAGVRASWGEEFEIYTSLNVLATQRLLEACKDSKIGRFVYASSSSVYGDSEELPLREGSLLKPISPYGVTKLAGEHLCCSYWKNYQIPVISLRYFTVYGPRQRPDMAFHKFIRAILNGEQIEIYGDGKQTRDFTFISDAVSGNILAMNSDAEGEVFNIGGGSRVLLNEVLDSIQKIAGKTAEIVYRDVQKGDVRHTLADTSKAKKYLGYNPMIDLETGLAEQWKWLKKLRDLGI
jgi:UDP-glucose 4-epimerase